MNYGGMYWNIKDYLPYQRGFYLINSERSIGKTYTTQGFLLERAIQKGEEFVYIVRTQDERKEGILEKAFEKVIQYEFPHDTIAFSKDDCTLVIEDEEDPKIKEYIPLGHCIALSEATKKKKINFPNVKWMIFDEYIVDEKERSAYVNGWNEPDLLLKIYHTIDRERDYVVCFLLANNITFYNPYHMHKAFNIPHVKKDEIWLSENVLFHWCSASLELKEKKSKCKFLKMIEATEYGNYAVNGEYVNDNDSFIMSRTVKAVYIMTIEHMGWKFAVWQDERAGFVFIDTKVDVGHPTAFALTLADHKENTLLTKGRTNPLLKWLGDRFKHGNVRYVSMDVKVRAEEAIKLLL